ncbi:hypothetical protein JY651_22905 [Pyxidicoccus parkwayensis]|uniref:Phage protein D n=1 Tax=Pyxidicoccus parkwayensis TaxID=2813578 RepID=A0ABX7PAW1_9BACT|nr:hypothetical protein [Pyxidicoccus parkwaysis]QSQ27587.1 hypothetical protein JY651_22905 [Pyxidicoccus parkwaysis]
MGMLGVNLLMMVGPAVPLPAPPPLIEALQSVEVTHNDEGRSGFQLTFSVGRAGPLQLVDYGLLANPMLQPFNRVVLVVTFNVVPQVLFDGIITHRQLTPSEQPGASTLTVTGEDVSTMMDLEQKVHEHPAQVEPLIALQLIARYAKYQMVPMVLPPPTLDVPLPIVRTPVFRGTDYAYLQEMARRFGYVFYVEPGPAPLMNKAYWGPPVRTGVPQRALSVNMGADTNVNNISFQYNALEPTTVSGKAMVFGKAIPVETFISMRLPPLAALPAVLVHQPNVRKTLLEVPDGTSYVAAYAQAQAMTDASTDKVLTGSGELDALRYGDLLRPRGLVGLRGVGWMHDGFYYVKNVTHSIKVGEYKQRFTLTREGLGALLPVVPP